MPHEGAKNNVKHSLLKLYLYEKLIDFHGFVYFGKYNASLLFTEAVMILGLYGPLIRVKIHKDRSDWTDHQL